MLLGHPNCDFETPKRPSEELPHHQILHNWIQNKQGGTQVGQKGGQSEARIAGSREKYKFGAHL